MKLWKSLSHIIFRCFYHKNLHSVYMWLLLICRLICRSTWCGLKCWNQLHNFCIRSRNLQSNLKIFFKLYHNLKYKLVGIIIIISVIRGLRHNRWKNSRVLLLTCHWLPIFQKVMINQRFLSQNYQYIRKVVKDSTRLQGWI